MKALRQTELIVTLILVFLLVIFINPVGFGMSYGLHEFVLALVVVVFGLYVGLLQNEDPADERERWHIMMASRGGYIAALCASAVGVFVQAISGKVDPWLMSVLLVLVLAKLLTGIWARRRF